MLIALTDAGSRTAAWEALRGTVYGCPVCAEPVILHQGKKRIAHYAHRPGSDCTHEGESREHVEMKHAVWTAMRTAPGVTRCELEWPLGSRRADVFVETEHGQRVAVEAQVSSKEEPEFEAKIADYGALGVLPLYLVHAKAFRGYVATFKMGSLHEREVRVPQWVLSLALVDPSAEQSLQTYSVCSDTEYQLHTILQVFDGTDAWLVRLEPLWRDAWDAAQQYVDQYNPKQLRLLRVVGQLDLARGPEAASHLDVPRVGDHAWVTGTPALLGQAMRPSDRPTMTPPGLVAATAEYRAYARAVREDRKRDEVRKRIAARPRRRTDSLRDERVIPLTGAAVPRPSAGPVATTSSTASPSAMPVAAEEQFDLGLAESPGPINARRRTRIED